MSRRPVNPTARRFAESAVTPLSSPSHQKSRSSPLLSIGLILLGAILLLGYSYSGTGTTKYSSKEGTTRETLGINEEDELSCGLEILKVLPILREVYGESMHKVLHVGPDTCTVTPKLLKEEGIEAWGIEPFDITLDNICRNLIRKGVVRVADIKYALPYRAQSFSAVLVSDVPDSLSPKYLNKTIPDLARVSVDGVVMFVGRPGRHSSSKAAQIIQQSTGRPPKLRSKAWWQRSFEGMGLQENESMTKKFEELLTQSPYKPKCQIFHLSPDISL